MQQQVRTCNIGLDDGSGKARRPPRLLARAPPKWVRLMSSSAATALVVLLTCRYFGITLL